MLDLQQLKTFTVVVATNSFTRAASKLGYAQSTVTFQIKAIEKELGVQLFHRRRFTRKIILTEEGKAALKYAQQLLTMAEGVKTKISSLSA